MSELWRDLEERRIVIEPDIDELSEVSIRKSFGVSIRFIYQEKSNKHLEKIDTVKSSLEIGPINTASFPDTDFYISNNIISRLTPIKVLLSKGILKEQIKANIANIKLTYDTEKIFTLVVNNPIRFIVDDEMKAFLEYILEYNRSEKLKHEEVFDIQPWF